MAAGVEHSERDARLAEVLEAIVQAARHGPVDFQEYERRHPDLAVELRELWGVARMAEELGSGLIRANSPHAAPRSGGEAPDPSPHERDEVTIAPGWRAPAGALESRGLPAPHKGSPPRQFGCYEILEVIGQGGMGVVYKARDSRLGRIVAVKMLLKGDLASASDISRLRSEAEAVAQFDHPHIIPIYDIGECDGQAYFTMKYIDGTTLSRRLSEGPLPSREAAELLAPICRAVDAAHRRGILHRDLKPSNILIDRAGVPHVGDFGLAKRLAPDPSAADGHRSLTHSGAILGTPSYMAPEQAAGDRGELSPASDVYSLGSVLYHMLTGRPPFQAAASLDTLLMVLEQDPLPPRLLNPRADRDLEMICLKCLQKPPDLRYASAGDLADDLEAYLNHGPISARSTNLSRIVSRMLRETHHAGVLENWGLLWMWHSLVLLVLCVITNLMHLGGVESPWPYLGLWGLGLGTWAGFFWALRRRGGPITFVERQVAHLWAGSVVSSFMLFLVELLLRLPVLTLSPVLGLVSGMVFLAKAGILTGAFYVQALALFATSVAMAVWPDYGQTIFGVVSALCFFLPGWKYHHQRRASDAAASSKAA